MSVLRQLKALEWLEPWGLVTHKRALELEKELRRELSWRHDLSGRKCEAVAARGDEEVIAFIVDSVNLAIVQLTWSAESNTLFPSTTELSPPKFVEQMRADHDALG
ncbi:MAG: hypothetical protein ACI9KE_004668 [Polyangiales bacterium]|jgi:hypothetical protein